MLLTYRHTPNRQPSKVTVMFGDGAHSFQLRDGATLTELANHIGILGADHDGAPISIDIEFMAPRENHASRSLRAITH